jgi:hypothetical protein
MKKTLILITILFIVITVIVILGNVITIGEKITAVIGVPYLEYFFYIVIFALLLYLVLYPMYRIYTTPEFPVLAIEEQGENVSDDVYKKRLFSFANRICDNCYYLPESKRGLHQAALSKQLAQIKKDDNIEDLKSFLQQELDIRLKGVDRRIMNYSSKVFIVTAISQSDRFDALTTLILNYRMIDDIVRASGFRPTKAQLVKQYGRILIASFFSYFVSGAIDTDGIEIKLADAADGVADGLDSVTDLDASAVDGMDIDISDMDLAAFDLADVNIGNVDFTKIMKSIKIPGFAIDSILDGIANTIMTLRIGYVTRSYLKKGAKELKGVKGAYVRKDAMISALKNFPVLLAEIPQRVGTGAWSKVIELLTKIYKVEEESVADTSTKEKVKPKKKGFFHFFR